MVSHGFGRVSSSKMLNVSTLRYAVIISTEPTRSGSEVLATGYGGSVLSRVVPTFCPHAHSKMRSLPQIPQGCNEVLH